MPKKWPWKNHPQPTLPTEVVVAIRSQRKNLQWKEWCKVPNFFSSMPMVGLVTGVGQKWGERKLYGKRWLVVPLLVVCWSFLQRTNMGSGIFSQNALISTRFLGIQGKNAPDRQTTMTWSVYDLPVQFRNFFILDLILMKKSLDFLACRLAWIIHVWTLEPWGFPIMPGMMGGMPGCTLAEEIFILGAEEAEDVGDPFRR